MSSGLTHLSPLRSLLSGSDGLVKLWTIKTNECVKTLDAHQDKVWGLHASTKDDKMVTGSADSNITVWMVSVLPVTHTPTHTPFLLVIIAHIMNFKIRPDILGWNKYPSTLTGLVWSVIVWPTFTFIPALSEKCFLLLNIFGRMWLRWSWQRSRPSKKIRFSSKCHTTASFIKRSESSLQPGVLHLSPHRVCLHASLSPTE